MAATLAVLFAQSGRRVLLIGCDPHAIGEIDHRMDRACAHNWFAKAAIEMACWDIQGRAAGKPVYELLGGPCRPLTITCRFSMGAYEPERARRRAAEGEAQRPPRGRQPFGLHITPPADVRWRGRER